MVGAWPDFRLSAQSLHPEGTFSELIIGDTSLSGVIKYIDSYPGCGIRVPPVAHPPHPVLTVTTETTIRYRYGYPYRTD